MSYIPTGKEPALMESSLHHQLKLRFGPESGGQAEVWVDGHRIDAIDCDGTLIEVQTAPLSALRGKLSRLLPSHAIRVIKPVPITRWIIRREKAKGPDVSRRRSPVHGLPIDAFDDLVGIAKFFPHRNLTVEVLGVEIEEVRIRYKRRRRDHVVDRLLVDVVSSTQLKVADDLWKLLPGVFDAPFTTLDCANAIGRSVTFAQRVAYCLRLAGAVQPMGFSQRRKIYTRVDPLTCPAVA